MAHGFTGKFFAKNQTGAGTGDLLASNNLSDISNAATARTNLGLETLATATSPLGYSDGGTSQTSRQAALDSITNVSAATNEHVLTKDTASGNSIFKVVPSLLWSESGSTDYLTTIANKVAIGRTSLIGTEKFVIDGSADIIQCIIRGHSTQTGNILEVRKSDDSIMLGVSATQVTIGGTGSGIALNENASIALDPAGSADGKYSGITVTGTAGDTLAFGDLIYLATNSKWLRTDADAVATCGAVMTGMCVLAANDTQATTILLQGIIRADANFPALTIGAPVYASTTPGDIQVAQPSGTDDVIQVVGFALTADEIYFDPSHDYITKT